MGPDIEGFLKALTELSKMYGVGIALGIPNQPATLFILESYDLDINDYNREYSINDQGELLYE